MNEEHKKLYTDFSKHLEIKGYKKRGIEEKIRRVKEFLAYIEEEQIELRSLRIKEAESYREYLSLLTDDKSKSRYSAGTINSTIAHLRSFFMYLQGLKIVLRNPFMEIEKVKVKYALPRNILSIEEMGKLLDGIEVKSRLDFKFKVVIEILYSTGCRISEIEKLRKKDIDLEEGYIKIIDDKESQDRRCCLTECALKLLKAYIEIEGMGNKEEEHIFRHGHSFRGLNSFMNERLKAVTKKLKLPYISSHGIRHSIATHLFKNGADIREVQEFLGHKRIKNTEIYTRLILNDLKNVIEKTHPREVKEEEDEES